tara:strand:- start:64 stop:357 length:294 start_codon:yes stop_codon:yes gene_type:complete
MRKIVEIVCTVLLMIDVGEEYLKPVLQSDGLLMYVMTGDDDDESVDDDDGDERELETGRPAEGVEVDKKELEEIKAKLEDNKKKIEDTLGYSINEIQ